MRRCCSRCWMGWRFKRLGGLAGFVFIGDMDVAGAEILAEEFQALFPHLHIGFEFAGRDDGTLAVAGVGELEGGGQHRISWNRTRPCCLVRKPSWRHLLDGAVLCGAVPVFGETRHWAGVRLRVRARIPACLPAIAARTDHRPRRRSRIPRPSPAASARAGSWPGAEQLEIAAGRGVGLAEGEGVAAAILAPGEMQAAGIERMAQHIIAQAGIHDDVGVGHTTQSGLSSAASPSLSMRPLLKE